MQNKLRIIGGLWRSRLINFADIPELRPTPGRVRETLFNWLQYDVVGSHCLDLFSGSGALGLEAVSRGANSVVQVENNVRAFKQLQDNADQFSPTQIQVVQQDVFGFLAGKSRLFNLVFLDPPFYKNLALQACLCLEENGWLLDQAKIYVEVERQLELQRFPENWQLLQQKTAGEVTYCLFLRHLASK